MKRRKMFDERSLVERIKARTPRNSRVILGIGDDTAVLFWKSGREILFTCDILIEGTHFTRKKATPFQIGWKALCRNISDIAAMGGLPRYAVVSAGLPAGTPLKVIDGIYDGLLAAAKKFDLALVGGDMSRSERIVIDVALIGEVETGKAVTRGHARPGDIICVTGSLGGSAGGKHLDFTPRLKESQDLVKRARPSAMIDVSDGLLLDLDRILTASDVGAVLYQHAIPVSPEASSFEAALSDGEDFELLFTLPSASARRLLKRPFLSTGRTPVSVIGEITAQRKSGMRIVGDDGRPRKVQPKGFLHF